MLRGTLQKQYNQIQTTALVFQGVVCTHHSQTRRLLSSDVLTNRRFSSTKVIVLTAPRWRSYSWTTSPVLMSHWQRDTRRREQNRRRGGKQHIYLSQNKIKWIIKMEPQKPIKVVSLHIPILLWSVDNKQTTFLTVVKIKWLWETHWGAVWNCANAVKWLNCSGVMKAIS